MNSDGSTSAAVGSNVEHAERAAHPEFDHLLLTRFNLRLPGMEPPDDDWMRHRFRLFEQFCLPSVGSQTCQHFRWLIFCDDSTPSAWRERIEACQAVRDFTIVYLKEYDLSVVREVLRRFRGEGRYLNDDAIARDFIETVQRQVQRRHRRLLYGRFHSIADGCPMRDVRIGNDHGQDTSKENCCYASAQYPQAPGAEVSKAVEPAAIAGAQ